MSRRPTIIKNSPTIQSSKGNLKTLLKRHTTFISNPIEILRNSNIKFSQEKSEKGSHSSESKTSKGQIISLENFAHTDVKKNESSQESEGLKINTLFAWGQNSRSNSIRNVKNSKKDSLLIKGMENTFLLKSNDNDPNNIVRRSMQILSIEKSSSFNIEKDEENLSSFRKNAQKIRKMTSINFPQKGALKKNNLTGIFELRRSPTSKEENKNMFENYGQKLVEIEKEKEKVDIIEQDQKNEKSFELFLKSKAKLFSPKISGVPPKYFHKIKPRSMVIDKSLLLSQRTYF